MSKINQIQAAILSLDPGAYQKLMDSYIMRKYGFSNIMPLGSHSGTNKVTKGTPDAFVQCTDGRFILIAHGSVENHAYGKVQSDILNCLDTIKTGIAAEDISQIICCHTSTNFTPGQVKELCSYFENTILIGLGDVSFDLFHVGHDDCISAKELVEYFKEDIKVLCAAYIYAHQGRAYYDFDGELFLELVRSNPEFLADYVCKVEQQQIGKDGWDVLNILWKQDDYLNLISIVMEYLKDAVEPFFTWNSLAEELLSSHIDLPLADKRCNEWIKYYIESNYNDRVSMSFLFGVVCNLPEEQRLSAVMIFCKCNPDFDAFRNIHIMPTHASWSGSEVPIIEQYIAFLIKFRENLKGIQFIEHRAYISEEIQDLQKRKEEVLLREFLEER